MVSSMVVTMPTIDGSHSESLSSFLCQPFSEKDEIISSIHKALGIRRA